MQRHAINEACLLGSAQALTFGSRVSTAGLLGPQVNSSASTVAIELDRSPQSIKDLLALEDWIFAGNPPKWAKGALTDLSSSRDSSTAGAWVCRQAPGFESWSEKRQIEFLLGRLCAREALAHSEHPQSVSPTAVAPHVDRRAALSAPDLLGPQIALGRLQDGTCQWPERWSGSISHAHLPDVTSGLPERIIAIALSYPRPDPDRTDLGHVQASGNQDFDLGVDVAAWSRFDSTTRLMPRIAIPEELKDAVWQPKIMAVLTAAQALRASSRPEAPQNPSTDALKLALLFSAKESLYKALYPSVRRYFGFLDAVLIGARLSPDSILEMVFRLATTLIPEPPPSSKGALTCKVGQAGQEISVRAKFDHPTWLFTAATVLRS